MTDQLTHTIRDQLDYARAVWMHHTFWKRYFWIPVVTCECGFQHLATVKCRKCL